jgi:hypothetical protein
VFTGAEALAASVVTFKILLIILETLKYSEDKIFQKEQSDRFKFRAGSQPYFDSNINRFSRSLPVL